MAAQMIDSSENTSLQQWPSLTELVRDVFPGKSMHILEAIDYKKTYLGTTTKLTLQTPDAGELVYFLKTVNVGVVGAMMCEGEYESLKAIHAISPRSVPKPISWGPMIGQGEHAYYILEAFCNMSGDLAGAEALTSALADIHNRSRPPTGKFGFHVKTCHGPIVQQVDQWEDSWAVFYKRHLKQYMDIAKPIMKSTEFDKICQQTLDHVVPELLMPLQQNGRTLKPSLVHGDCWDGNTALSPETGRALVFDACSFYGHNEYDIGNWRATRHRVSTTAYLDAYKKKCPVSDPVEDWEGRNVLYSLPFNLGNIINIANSDQREQVVQDMQWLCAKYQG